MPFEAMSADSAKNRKFSGRRTNEEAELFLVQEIHGSPVMRGRRHNSEEQRFLVEDIHGSPVRRGRVPRVTTSTRTSQDESTGTRANTSSNVREKNLTSDTMDNAIRMTPIAPLSSSNIYVINSTHPKPPNGDDAPPSYESSLPPTQIGWSTKVTSTIPFSMSHSTGQDDRRRSNIFSYPPSDPYPSIGLSPIAKSYQSIESSNSKSPIRSTSPSLSPSPDRLRPAYTYQPRRVERTPPPRYRMDNNNENFVIKPQNDFTHRYCAIIIAVAFLVFLMLISLAAKFIIQNSFN